MAEDDILGASFRIDSSDIQSGANEILGSLDKIKSGVEKSSSAIESIANKLQSGAIKSKDAFEQLNKILQDEGKSVEAMARSNSAALDALASKRDKLQAQRSNNYNPNELNNISKQIAKIEAEKAARESLSVSITAQQKRVAELLGELQRNANSAENTTQAQTSLKGEIRQITAELVRMEAAGLRGSEAYNALRARGAALTDQMGDARKQLSLLSHDNATLQGVISGVQGLTGAFTAATGAMALFGTKNEDLQRAMVKVQAVMSISMGIQQTLNALNKDSALRLGIIAKLQEAWSAAKARAATATATESAALASNNAALSTNATAQAAATSAVNTGTAANAAHAASWRAVGIAIKSVPVFGWLITAVAALAAAIGLLHAKTKQMSEGTRNIIDTTKRTQELADTQKKISVEAERELSSIARLNNTLKNAEKGSIEWKNAKAAIISQYGQYHNGLDKEIDKVGYLSSTYNDLTTNVRASIAARKMQEIAESDQTNDNIYEFLQGARQTVSQDFHYKKGGKTYRSHALSDRDRAQFMAEINDYAYGRKDYSELTPMVKNILANNKAKSGSTLKTALGYWRSQYSKSEDEILAAAEVVGFSKDDARSILTTGRVANAQGYKDTQDTTTAQTSTAKQSTKAVEDNGAAVRAAIGEEALKTQRAIEDAVYKENKAEIDARAESLNKTLASINLEHERKMQLLQRSVEDEAIRLKKFDKDNNIALSDNDTYLERARINTGYYTDSQIADSDTAAARTKAYIQLLSSLKSTAKEVSTSVDWQRVFGDVSKFSAAQLTNAKAFLKERLSSGELSIKDYKAAAEQIDKINEQQAKSQNSIASALGLINPYLQKRKALELALQEATERDAQAQERKAQAVKDTYDAQLRLQRLLDRAGIDASADSVQNIFAALQANGGNIDSTTQDSIISAIKNYQKLQSEQVDAQNLANDTQVNLMNTQDSLSAVSSDMAGMVGVAVTAVSALNADFQELHSLLVKLGVDLDTDFGHSLDNAASAFDNISTALQDLTQANIVGAISSLVSAAMSAGNAIFGTNTEYDDLIKKYTNVISVWDTLISKKREYISQSWGVEAVNATQEALSLLQTEIQVQQSIASAATKASASWYSHSVGYKMWSGKGTYGFEDQTWQNQASAIAQLTGADFTQISDLANMTSEQLQLVREKYAGLWGAMDSDFRTALENIISYGEQADDIIDALNEKLTGFSFESLESSFVSSLMNMDALADDFAEDLSKKLMQASLQSAVSEVYGEQLQTWYDDFASSMKKGSLTSTDIARLSSAYEQIVDGALELRDSIAEATGYDITSSQSSSSKAVSSITATQADELNGRFTALQIAGEALRTQSELQTLSLDTICADTQQITYTTSQIAESIRASIELQQTSAAHLANIESYTSNLPQMLERLTQIERNTQNI